MTLEARHVFLSLGKRVLFKDFSLKAKAGQIVTLMGESGSGKSSFLLFMLGSLDLKTFAAQGSIFLADTDISNYPVEKRNIGILFQDPLLFPHITVEENMLFALPAAVKGAKQRAACIHEILEKSKLPLEIKKRYPHTLSGGEAARISLIRTLLSRPKALLLDEPFSKLDEQNRKNFRSFVFQQIADYQLPTIMVTHETRDYAAIPKAMHAKLFRL